MQNKLDSLRQTRDSLLERQRSATQEIVHHSIDPVRATFLINELIFTASENREMLRRIDVEIERRRMGWWARFWNK